MLLKCFRIISSSFSFIAPTHFDFCFIQYGCHCNCPYSHSCCWCLNQNQHTNPLKLRTDIENEHFHFPLYLLSDPICVMRLFFLFSMNSSFRFHFRWLVSHCMTLICNTVMAYSFIRLLTTKSDVFDISNFDFRSQNLHIVIFVKLRKYIQCNNHRKLCNWIRWNHEIRWQNAFF